MGQKKVTDASCEVSEEMILSRDKDERDVSKLSPEQSAWYIADRRQPSRGVTGYRGRHASAGNSFDHHLGNPNWPCLVHGKTSMLCRRDQVLVGRNQRGALGICEGEKISFDDQTPNASVL